ncbi:MAG: adenylate kinase [Vulcanimicrobiota bacterium]
MATAQSGKDSGVRLLLIGPPGSGKGTQAKHLTEKFRVPHVSTGDMLREQIRKGTSLGEEAAAYIKDGNLVPDELILNMVKVRLAQSDTASGYVLDGFPRSVAQAEALCEFLEARQENVKAAVLLILDDETIVARLCNRRVCPECGRVYHLLNHPPQTADRCDENRCRATLVQRPDDNEEAIRNRLRIYHDQTKSVIVFYREKGVLKEIDASREILRIQIDIERALEGDL